MRKFIILSFVLILASAVPASAQRINLDIFPQSLADKAEEVVDVTLDASMIRLAATFFGKGDGDERAIRDLLMPLTGIYVRSYDFGRAGEYDMALVEKVKSQLGPTWKPMVTVRSKKKENVNIYADMRGDRVVGLVVIAAEPNELTFVNIVGPIDIERLADLSGHFGIPDIDGTGTRGKERRRD
jgi:Domain of unknown function (DUF4252)